MRKTLRVRNKYAPKVQVLLLISGGVIAQQHAYPPFFLGIGQPGQGPFFI